MSAHENLIVAVLDYYKLVESDKDPSGDELTKLGECLPLFGAYGDFLNLAEAVADYIRTILDATDDTYSLYMKLHRQAFIRMMKALPKDRIPESFVQEFGI